MCAHMCIHVHQDIFRGQPQISLNRCGLQFLLVCLFVWREGGREGVWGCHTSLELAKLANWLGSLRNTLALLSTPVLALKHVY